MDNTLATRFGIHAWNGLQTRTWGHGHSMSFRCVLCGEEDYMANASVTLFDGQEQLGDLCEVCIVAGPAAAAARTHRWAEQLRDEDLREQAEGLDELASDLSKVDPAHWSLLAELDVEREQVMREMR